MQNANLTWAQDLGAVTELLSGQFYQALGRSTAHQLWSSAMVISPVTAWDVWSGVECGGGYADDFATFAGRMEPGGDPEVAFRQRKTVDVAFRREGRAMLVQASDPEIHLGSRIPGAEAREWRAAYSAARGRSGDYRATARNTGLETQTDEGAPEEGYGDHELTLRLSAPQVAAPRR